MREVTLLEMLKRGVHFGHRESRWHPKMRPYIYTSRQGVHIIDLEKTSRKLQEAYDFMKLQSGKGAVVLFVGTKRQAQKIVIDAAQRAGMPYVAGRWLGGTLTNFVTVSKLIKKLKSYRQSRDSGGFEKYTKKEQLEFTKEIKRLEDLIGGIETLQKLPDVVFVEDVKQESTAVREARKMGVPIVGLVDTNANPDLLDYPIPANDDATKSLELLVSLMADAIVEGRASVPQPSAPAVSEEEKIEKKAEEAHSETAPVPIV